LTKLYGGAYGIYLPHSCLFLCLNGYTIGSTVLDPIWEVSKRTSVMSGGTFWERDDESKHVCKPMVHHYFFILLPFFIGASDLGCLPCWRYLLCLIVSCLVLVGGGKQQVWGIKVVMSNVVWIAPSLHNALCWMWCCTWLSEPMSIWGRKLMKIDGYFLMQVVIIVFQVGLALLRYCEDDLVCFLTLI